MHRSNNAVIMQTEQLSRIEALEEDWDRGGGFTEEVEENESGDVSIDQ